MEKQLLFSEGFDEKEKQAYVGPPMNVTVFSSSYPPAKGDPVLKHGKVELDCVILWYVFDKDMKYYMLAENTCSRTREILGLYLKLS